MTDDVTYCLNGCQRADENGVLRRVTTQHGYTLCQSCVYRLTKYIRSIAETFPQLADHLLPGSVDSNPESKATKAPTAPVPIRLAVVDLADARHLFVDERPLLNVRGATGVVQTWAEMIRTTRHMTTRPARVTMNGELDTIHGSWEYVLRQPWARSMYDDLRRLAGRLATAVGQYRRKPVGRCPTLILDDEPGTGDSCGGALLIVDDTVLCARCGRVWSAEDLNRLGLMLEPL